MPSSQRQSALPATSGTRTVAAAIAAGLAAGGLGAYLLTSLVISGSLTAASATIGAVSATSSLAVTGPATAASLTTGAATVGSVATTSTSENSIRGLIRALTGIIGLNVTATGTVQAPTVAATSTQTDTLTLAGGTAASKYIATTQSHNYGQISTGSCESQTFTVTGAAAGDHVFVAAPLAWTPATGTIGSVYGIPSTNAVDVYVCNASSTPMETASGTARITVFK